MSDDSSEWKHQYTFKGTDAFNRRVRGMEYLLGCENHNVFAYAIDVLEVVTKAHLKGHRVIVRHPDGTEHDITGTLDGKDGTK